MKLTVKFVLSAALLLLALTPVSGEELTFVHGVPGADLGIDPLLPVDVSLSGNCRLVDVNFGSIVGPLTVSVRNYYVEIRLAGEQGPCRGPRLASAFIQVNFEEDVTVVVHLTTDGGLAVTKYVNDQRPAVTPGQARVVVRHVADAPKVDVWVDTETAPPIPVFREVQNPDQVKAEVAPESYQIVLAPAGISQIVHGPMELTVAADNAYFIYAIGTLASDTLDLLVQTEPLN